MQTDTSPDVKYCLTLQLIFGPGQLPDPTAKLSRGRIRSLLVGMLLGLLSLDTASAAADYTPFQIRDQNPFNLIHGQPLPADARLVGNKNWRISSTLAVTNTPNTQQLADESILMDFESYRFTLAMQYGFTRDWAMRIELPVVHKGAGFMDSFINDWHNFFNLPQGNRPDIANDQYRIVYLKNGHTVSDLQIPDSGIGELQLNLARQVFNTPQSSLSLWSGLKLPTGKRSTLNGNGAIDLSAWLAYKRQLAPQWTFNTNAGLVLPAVIPDGSKSALNSDLSTYVAFGYLTLAWQPLDKLDIKAQLEAHSSYYKHSELRILGSTYLATFGGSVHINPCNSIDLAFSEDIKVEASPDISFLLSWRYSGHCH